MTKPEAISAPAENTKSNISPATSTDLLRLTENVKLLFDHADQIAKATKAAAIAVLWPGKAEWTRLRNLIQEPPIIVVVDTQSQAAGPKEAGFSTIVLNMPAASPLERVSQTLVECVSEDLLSVTDDLVVIYGVFDPGTLDSLGVFKLSDYLGRLTVRELRQLQTDIPLETLKTVINLAIEIGREGREGKPVGTTFVVGDTRKVLAHTRPLGFDPVRGYSKRERNLFDPRVREGIKEIAQLDGAFVINKDGEVVAACRHIDCSADGINLSKGLGSRHWAAAAITRRSKAIAICVSESSGTVRVFQNGELRMRIEPEMKRPVVWKESDFDGAILDERR
ncbi:MAG: DNA integrity scanning protein DisA nucleotide-binding domain protein [Thermogutta sp.]